MDNFKLRMTENAFTLSRILVFKAAVQNSKLPRMEPSAWVQVLPALRSTKMSPGMASKTVSSAQLPFEMSEGTRESPGSRPKIIGKMDFHAPSISQIS